MSLDVFPSFKGIAWPSTVRPVFATLSQQSASGRLYQLSQRPYPQYLITLAYNYFLRSDYITLAEFFKKQKAAASPFYLDVLDDDSVVGAAFGTGDGSTKTFPLMRGTNFQEPVYGTFGSETAYVAGTAASATFDGAGNVTFATAPANGAALTWTGSYYYRVVFSDDYYDFEQFLHQVYRLQQIKFQTLPP